MRVKEIQVKGLFGTFDHVIPLTHVDRLTIIHGPNGFGKTMMLKMIAALVENETSIFLRIPFTEFRVILDDGTTGLIRRFMDSANEEKQQPKIEVSMIDAEGNIISSDNQFELIDIPHRVLDTIDNKVPSPFVLVQDGWYNSETERFYKLNEILQLFPHVEKLLPKKYRIDPFSKITQGLEVFFVETKRLDAERVSSRHVTNDEMIAEQMTMFDPTNSRPSQQKYSLRVDQYSRDIAQRIKTTLADYAKHSQENDRTFPERLVRFVRENEYALPAKHILEKMIELENKRQRLISLGFLDSETGLQDLTEDDVTKAPEALTIYVGDVQQKLAVFDDLSHRVGKIIDILNERFKYKNMSIHREEGFRVNTDSGDIIKLEDLSSGEQHELVVLYELLFRAPKKGLVLVDEPEISLHVGWQSRFLADLMSILELTDSYGIVATHSPVIIGTRWDLTQQLKGPDGAVMEAQE